MKLKFQKLNEDRLDDMTDEYLDYEIENPRLVTEPEQKYTSKKTSRPQVPKLHKDMVKKKFWKDKSVNLDYGGGGYDLASDFVHNLGVLNLVYDPFWRDKKHNQRVENYLIHNGGADSATCANVLNVLSTPQIRRTAIENIHHFLKDGCYAYFSFYRLSGAQEGPTTNGYQLHRKTAEYLPEIEAVFGHDNVTSNSDMIIARK